MKLYAQALAGFIGSTDYHINGTEIHVANNKFSLLSCEKNSYTFRISSKIKHADKDLLEHYTQSTIDTTIGFFAGMDTKSFLTQFTKTTCIVIDADMNVSFKSIFTKKKSKFILSIPLFEQRELDQVNFTIEKRDSHYITCMKSWNKENHSHSLKHLYLLTNFEREIKKMLGSIDDIERCSELLDMYFL